MQPYFKMIIYRDDEELSESFVEGESEVGEDSVMPVSPGGSEEDASHESEELSLGFLFSNPAHRSGFLFRESNFDLDKQITVHSLRHYHQISSGRLCSLFDKMILNNN